MQKINFIVEGVEYTLEFSGVVTPGMYKASLLRGDVVLNYDLTHNQYQTPWLAVNRLLGDFVKTSRYTRGESSTAMYDRIEEIKTVLDGLDDAGVRHQVIKIKEYEDE